MKNTAPVAFMLEESFNLEYERKYTVNLHARCAVYTTSDIYPVSDFNRKTSEHIKCVQETKKPQVLTVNGKAAVVIVDPESYDELAQNQELLQSIKNIVITSEQHESGQAKPAKPVFQELKDELKAKYPDADL